ncbi:MAG: phosphatidate cytidylyltransferase [Pseudomonadota bacterium]
MTLVVSPSLMQRLITALIFGPVTFALWFYGGVPFLVFLLVMLLVSAWEWTGMSLRLPPTPVRGIVTVVGILYLAACFLAIARLGIHYGRDYAILLLLMIWMSDSFGYAFGKTIGGPKMAPVLSPNKTYAGLLGAMVGPAVTVWLYTTFLTLPDTAYIDQRLHILIGAGLGACGQAGDILISAMKRKVGVKDTGTILPGHGGVLDRIDALLLAGLAYLIIISFTLAA